MAAGYLQIQAQTAQEAVPLEGAQVWVLDAQGNVLCQLATDISGKTAAVALETLEQSLSQNPDYQGLPYISYNIIVEAEGFELISITDIPIFDGETAVLPVLLTPLQERQSRQMTELTVGKPAVSMPYVRKQEGTAVSMPYVRRQEGTAASMPYMRNQEGTAADARVLRHVVIPNPITVHLGTPASSAANVRVSFLDYVKNVASSEIYPTWPQASLKANIYAIMTFALNRVYTEWYRSRGYSFDITNSTAYDQYYVPGRPVYSSISNAVDEIFGGYVRRPGQDAPYFTSFCNGSTATCQGLSQWGTVSLADRGYSPLQILRYYYPKDIEIVKTNIITSSLSSYPGAVLRLGSSGLAVQTVQTFLNRIRRNYPAVPVITDSDGSFGESTRNAVIKFQRIFNLAPDGIVGEATWYKLSSLYTAVTRLAELDSEGSRLGIGTVPPDVVLRQGSRGQDVITLQYLLNTAAQYYPEVPAPAQDGIFGSKTLQSVMAFQQRMNLIPDGIVGVLTWKNLYDIYLGMAENTPTPGPDNSLTVYTVRRGDSLWLIARRFGTTVEALMQTNGLTSDVLQIGQILRIPAR